MNDIFISYAREDKQFVKSLSEELESKGWSVWWDRNLEGGSSFRKTIKEEILSAKCVIVLWSKHSIDADFVLDEVSLGQGRRVLLPVRIEEVELPFGFGQIHTVNLLKWRKGIQHNGFNQLLEDITRFTGKSVIRSRKPGKTSSISLSWLQAVILGIIGIVVLVILAPILFNGRVHWPPVITDRHGMSMVLVPTRKFIMGSPEGEGDKDEYPPHTVDLAPFYIDQYEVTVQQYRRFMAQTNRSYPAYWRNEVDLKRDAQKPVVGIRWMDAKDYCKWLDKRLPTEAEWEKAARGDDKRIFPWGDPQPLPHNANFGNVWTKESYRDGLKTVGRYEKGKSPYGIYDMAGNVSEWVADWYDENYYRNSPEKNPKGPKHGKKRILRGGSWRSDPHQLRSADRLEQLPSIALRFNGFRCAKDALSPL